jgi:hypothetical protein
MIFRLSVNFSWIFTRGNENETHDVCMTQEEKYLRTLCLIKKLVLQMKKVQYTSFYELFKMKKIYFCLYARSKITLQCKPKMLFSFECQCKLYCHSRINAKQSIKELCKQDSFLFVKEILKPK